MSKVNLAAPVVRTRFDPARDRADPMIHNRIGSDNQT
jgi:hypothetical protein